MKASESQIITAAGIYNATDANPFHRMRAAIESIPEPIPRLRPLAEMPAEVPEGALRVYGRLFLGEWFADQQQCPSHRDTHGADFLPPLPESPKPSFQDDLVTVLERLVDHGHSDDCNYLNFANAQCNCGVSEAEALIAKAKGGQP